MKLISKQKMKHSSNDDLSIHNQYNRPIESSKDKKPPYFHKGFFSPKLPNKDSPFIKSFNHSKPNQPRFNNNSSMNNSTNSTHIEKIFHSNTNNGSYSNTLKHLHSNHNKTNVDIEHSEYLRTEPTPTSTANTTNVEALMMNQKNNQLKHQSYNNMINIMKRSNLMSYSIKTMDLFKKPSSSLIHQSTLSLKQQKNKKKKAKPSIVHSAQNTIEKDDSNINCILQYKDLIQSNCNIHITIDVLKKVYPDYPTAIEYNKSIGFIKGYGVNTYKGLLHKDNEDRVSIIQNVPQPKNYKDKWPCCSLLGVYDGHGGKACANYLKDHLLNYIIKNMHFPNDPIKAIETGFEKAENEFLRDKCISSDNKLIEKSGSCAMVILIIDRMCYIANLGDSRALVSINQGNSFQILSKEHSLSDSNERKRIILNGGKIIQPQIPLNQFLLKEDNENDIQGGDLEQILYGPERVIPGHLSISRSIGDPEAKLIEYGGKANMIIAKPVINTYKISSNIDFIILGSDGIFEQMKNDEIIKAVWAIMNAENCNYGQCVDMIIKTALERNSLDNLTAIMISFSQSKSSSSIGNLEKIANDPLIDNNAHRAYATVESNHHRRKDNTTHAKLDDSIKTPPMTVQKGEKKLHLFFH